MPQNPLISVVMPVYNGEMFLSDSIESVLNQTFTDFEFIIINDGSIDGTLKIIRGYSDNRIKFVDNGANNGLTVALNKAIGMARGEYIARQDADDISLPHRFHDQVSYLDNHADVALLGSSVYHINEWGEICGRAIAPVKPGGKLTKSNWFCHGATMFRKNVFNEMGCYNPIMKYSQDYELWLRIARNHRVINLPQPLYKLRFHENNISVRHLKESALYQMLALKMSQGEDNHGMMEAISKRGINRLIQYLDRKEEARYHTLVANILAKAKKVEGARDEYITAFMLNRFENHYDIKNIINILTSYLGGRVLYEVHKSYFFMKNLYIYLQNSAAGVG